MDMPLDSNFITSCLPHGTEMILLDQVSIWREDFIECTSSAHLSSSHPLRRDGVLPAISLIELAAQSMAVHSAIAKAEETKKRKGVLAAVRNIKLYADHLDDIGDIIHIKVNLIMCEDRSGIYGFEAHAGNKLLAEGRLTVVIT